jgi:acetyl esterase/lipase
MECGLTEAMRRVKKSTLTLWSMWRSLVLVSAFFPLSFASSLSQGTTSQEGLPDTLNERFDLLDANQDGVLTMEEVGRPRFFRRLDADGDNVVTRAEAAASFERRSRRSQRAPAISEQEATAPKSADAGIMEDLNIPYSSLPGVDPNLLSLDIYRPVASPTNAHQGAHPVVVMIHGGGFRGGDKGNVSQGRQKASFFTGHGFVYVSVNYRLSPGVQHPAHVEDVARALAWVIDNIASYGGDPKRIFLMGHSAGAHLAALVTADEAYLNKLGKSPSMLSGIILLDSAGYDIPAKLDALSDRPLTRPLYEGTFGKDRQTWIQASPVQHVKRGKILPSFLVFYTERKPAEAISKEFVEALQKAEIPAAAVLAKGKSHRTINRDIGMPEDGPSGLILDFLNGKDLRAFPPSI